MYHTPGFKWLIYEPRALTWRVMRKARSALREVQGWFQRVGSRAVDQFSAASSSAEKLGAANGGVVDSNGHAVAGASVHPVCASPELGSPVSFSHMGGRHRADVGSSGSPLMPISEGSVVTLPMSIDGADDSRTLLSDSGTIQLGTPLQSGGGGGGNGGSGSGIGGSSAKGRLKSAVRSVMLRNAMSQTPFGGTGPRTPRRQRTSSSDGQHGAGDPMEDVASMRGSRLAVLVPRLKSLETTQDLAAHTALVRHLQFSPNGKFLATSR